MTPDNSKIKINTKGRIGVKRGS